MLNRSARAGLLLLVIGLIGLPARGVAQTAPAAAGDSLVRIVAGLDSAMFGAFNRCELDRLASFVAEDVRFFHDRTGLSLGRAPFMDAVRKNICGKVQRALVASSLEVFPIPGYGAVELATHRFCEIGHAEKCAETGSPARFVILWHRVGGGWEMGESISYDHH